MPVIVQPGRLALLNKNDGTLLPLLLSSEVVNHSVCLIYCQLFLLPEIRMLLKVNILKIKIELRTSA